jgi:hypothetical protein
LVGRRYGTIGAYFWIRSLSSWAYAAARAEPEREAAWSRPLLNEALLKYV